MSGGSSVCKCCGEPLPQRRFGWRKRICSACVELGILLQRTQACEDVKEWTTVGHELLGPWNEMGRTK
jgi:hypothetical protein